MTSEDPIKLLQQQVFALTEQVKQLTNEFVRLSNVYTEKVCCCECHKGFPECACDCATRDPG